ncbi:uncharacterized protein [Epargyreus clarus]|uniref:uncharacterized protein n=1 Tax=Epargyreus clarus TaxID=520877 RepID=UPI003C2C1E20
MLSEALGTVLLLLLTCLPAAGHGPLLQRAITAGLVVAVLVQCFDHISGAMFNPTVALAAAVAGRIRAWRAAALAAAQLLGAAAGAAALAALAPPGSAPACVTKPAPDLPVLQALGIEATLGGCLALANCAAWDARNRRLLDSWPLRIGLAVAGLSLVGGDLTGASMNPMRSLGPALCSGDWTHHWIYWVGPLSGSALCSALYRALWAAPAAAAPRAASPPARRRDAAAAKPPAALAAA